MDAISKPAPRKRHVNALQHMAGFFKKTLTSDERQELAEVITDFARGLVPLVVPLTLIRNHVSRADVDYLEDRLDRVEDLLPRLLEHLERIEKALGVEPAPPPKKKPRRRRR